MLHPLRTLLDDEDLYHWSPRERRKSIERRGLQPGSRSLQGAWRPPYIALSRDPIMAWTLVLRKGETDHLTTWDLWSVSVYDLAHYEMLYDHYPDTGRQFIHEVRVYDRIYKRDLNWVGERTINP